MGGIVDDGLSLLTDVVLVIPTFPLIIVIVGYLKSASFWLMVFVLVFTGWSYGARQLRVQALSLRNRDYLLAAKARGESSWYVITVELIPPMTSLIVANFLGAALYAVLASAGLQFVGLGNINTESWGTMLYWAQNNEALQTGLPLWALAPGVAIAVLGSGLALLNYAFDEVANPALRRVRPVRPASLARSK
jgi:peptide/nickel transport system permease protein